MLLWAILGCSAHRGMRRCACDAAPCLFLLECFAHSSITHGVVYVLVRGLELYESFLAGLPGCCPFFIFGSNFRNYTKPSAERHIAQFMARLCLMTTFGQIPVLPPFVGPFLPWSQLFVSMPYTPLPLPFRGIHWRHCSALGPGNWAGPHDDHAVGSGAFFPLPFPLE